MATYDDVPSYICPACEWRGDEDECIHCDCGRVLCPRKESLGFCLEPLITIEAYRKAQAQDARDAEKEDERLWGCFKPNIDTERKE